VFGPHCELWEQIHTLEYNLRQKKAEVSGNESILRFLIPQTYHAIITDTRQFFLQTATLPDVTLDTTERIPNPRRATSHLELQASQLIMLQDTQPLNMPKQLTAPWSKEEQKKQGNEKRNRETDTDTNPRFNKSQNKNMPEYITNRDPPQTFGKDAELQGLLTKNPRVSVNAIAQAAGFKNFAEATHAANLPRLCGSFVITQRCRKECFLNKNGEGHLPGAQYPPAPLKTLLEKLRPGIQKLMSE